MESYKDIVLKFYREYVELLKKYKLDISVHNVDRDDAGIYFDDGVIFKVELGDIENEEEFKEFLYNDDNWSY